MPRCHERNKSRRRRESSPSLDIWGPPAFPLNATLQRQKPGACRVRGLYRGLRRDCQRLALHSPGLLPFGAQASMPAMRPLVLNPLFASLTSLPGVGPKLELLYARLLGREAPRVVDLLFHLPSGAIDRRARPKLNEVRPGEVVTVAVTVLEHLSLIHISEPTRRTPISYAV